MTTNHRTPHTSKAPGVPSGDTGVFSARLLRERGLSPALIAERCAPGGPWQQLLPDVYLLHPGPPSSRERVQAALLYAGRDPGRHGPLGGGREAMVTGRAALALHGFTSVPPLAGQQRIDVLVPHQRRLRDAGDVALVRVRALPNPQELCGLPCVPVPRALADAVTAPDDPDIIRRMLTEAVLAGYCDGAAVLRELAEAESLDLPHVAAALPALHAADRTMGEDRLYAMVRCHRLPDPLWNVELVLPGGPPLGGVDAYWPDEAVAVVVDARAASAGHDDDAWVRHARQRERLEALGITLVHLTPAKLGSALEQQAAIVRTALMASTDRTPAAYVGVIPR
ncbi:hypothetical protein [Actinacidiphila acidipaludis]|uniref:Transcriptional regulator, AbiEi antitoxin, Type IV TA system n=1 Tax=Actinacidiphila acidipaludis TaxID=2873382 RepID=A0ABS7QC72_9ACTN|nr:hypothetical protein [Streptomyces acidipaludis]MBY8880775.1 hypothetical protein [Streptomyces acidipaludis]